MENLSRILTIYTTKTGVKVVNARELHSVMGIKKKYANDIKFEEIIKEIKEFISSLELEISTV